MRFPIPCWIAQNGCSPFRKSQLPRIFLTFYRFFSPCCHLNDHRKPPVSKIGRPSLLPLALILIFFIRKSNIHPAPGPVFPCSVCARNAMRRGSLVQCCTCSRWVHLGCSLISSYKFNALGSFYSLSCPCCVSTPGG